MAQFSGMHKTDFIGEVEANTLPDLFQARVKHSPDSIAYRQYDTRMQAWRSYTWREIQSVVSRWRQALRHEDLRAGDRVAIILKNGIDWVCFEQAAQSLGLVVVVLYPTDTPENIVYILADAGASVVLLDEYRQWRDLAPQQPSLPALRRVFYLQGNKDNNTNRDDICRSVDEVLPVDGSSYVNSVSDPGALATIIYTSGTTGKPKGVMLTHHNLLANAEAVQKIIPAVTDDVFLSFLPLAHGFERTVEYCLPMMAGCCVAYARSIQLLAEDLLEIQPTVFLSAPRLYEKIYTAVNVKIAPHWLKKKLFAWTIRLGWRKFKASQGRQPPLGMVSGLAQKVLHKIVADKVLSRLGGCIRVAVTGAAPMSEQVARFFLGLGLPLLEGYGLTEAGPVVSSNRPSDNVPGSVGKPLPDVEVSLAENDELLVRSPGVMQGYWGREEDTQKVIDKEGWLHTGDLAEIREGRIYIRGRLKEILVTSTGEKVPPADMEMVITLEPLFEQAMVVGEGKPFLSALVVLNHEAWPSFAAALGLDPEREQSLRSPLAVDAVLDKLAGMLGTFPGYAQIHAVHLTREAWTIDNGLLTPTLKIKRNVLEDRFEQEIKELYHGHLMAE